MENAQPPAQNLNVASDATTIYEGGKLIPMSVADLIGNEIALRQLVNTLNLSNRQTDDLRREIEVLKQERAAHLAQPAISVLLAAVNVCGAVLIAVGVNYVTATPPIRGGTVVIAIGAVLTAVTAVAPIILPSLITWFRERSHAY